MYTGLSDLPWTIIKSYPEYFSSAPKVPPALASPRIPVSGDFAVTVYRPEVGTGVPAKGPVPIISLLSGPRGSVPGPVSSYRILELIPLPPMKLAVSSSERGSFIMLFCDRSTLRILPTHPCEAIIDTPWLRQIKNAVCSPY